MVIFYPTPPQFWDYSNRTHGVLYSLQASLYLTKVHSKRELKLSRLMRILWSRNCRRCALTGTRSCILSFSRWLSIQFFFIPICVFWMCTTKAYNETKQWNESMNLHNSYYIYIFLVHTCQFDRNQHCSRLICFPQISCWMFLMAAVCCLHRSCSAHSTPLWHASCWHHK